MNISKLSEEQRGAVLNAVSMRENFKKSCIHSSLSLVAMLFIFLGYMLIRFSMVNDFLEIVTIVIISISAIFYGVMIFITLYYWRLYSKYKEITDEFGIDISDISYDEVISKIILPVLLKQSKEGLL